VTSPAAPSLLRSIAVKFALAVVLSITMVMTCLVILQDATLDRFADNAVADQATAQGSLLSDLLPPHVAFGKPDMVAALLADFVEGGAGKFTGVVVIGADGSEVAREGANVDEQLLEMARASLDQPADAHLADADVVAFPLYHGSDRRVGAMATRWSTRAMDAAMSEMALRELLVASLAGIVAVFLSYMTFRWLVLKPLRRLTTVVEELRTGKYDADLKTVERQDEFGTLARAVDDLRGHLSKGFQASKDAFFKSAAFNTSSSSMMLADAGGDVFAVNAAFRDLCADRLAQFRSAYPGFDPAALEGQNFTKYLPGAALTDDREKQSLTLALDDLRIAVDIVAIRNGDGVLTGYVLNWADVTETRKNQALLSEINTSQLRAEFAPDGRLVAENDLFRSLVGLSNKDRAQPSLNKILAAGQETVMEGIATGDGFAGKIALRSLNDGTVMLDGSLIPVSDSDGKPYRVFLLGRDITEHERTSETQRAERREIEAEQAAVVEALRVGLKRLSAGDLRATLSEPFASRYEELRKDFNATVEQLCEAMAAISERAETIRNESQDISGTAEVLSRRTESTAATLEQAAAALDDLTGGVRLTAERAKNANDIVRVAKSNAEDSGQVVLKTVTAMDEISASSEKVSSIIKVIDDIAFQTNLLALNAGVEAARAGEAGRGFAVVASEVRALAQRSSDAAREINDLIAQSVTQVKLGVDLVGETGESLRRIASSVNDISGQVSEIAGSAQSQSATLEEINVSVTQLDQSTQQNAARLEETTAASDALKSEAIALVDTIGHFQLSDRVVSLTPRATGTEPADPSKPAQREHDRSSEAQAPAKAANGAWTDF